MAACFVVVYLNPISDVFLIIISSTEVEADRHLFIVIGQARGDSKNVASLKKSWPRPVKIVVESLLFCWETDILNISPE